MAASNDPRFRDMHSAPIFKKQKREKFKVKVDDRFKGVVEDDRFRVLSADCYGRKKKKSQPSGAKEELKEFYEIEDEEPTTTSSKHGKKGGGDFESRLEYLNKLARGEVSGSSSSSENDSDGDSDNSSSDSYSDDGSDDNDAVDDPFAVPGDVVEYAEDDRAAAGLVEDSSRLAIQNCEWEKVTAEDLFMILQSFCPAGGVVRRVTVFPSDFGLQQLEQESLHGPPKNIWKVPTTAKASDDQAEEVSESDAGSVDESDSASEDSGSESDGSSVDILDIEDMQRPAGGEKLKGADFIRPSLKPGLVMDLNGDSEDEDAEVEVEGERKVHGARQRSRDKKISSDIDSVALRAYELSKLRYYFAIAEMGDSQTANYVYKELDGMELEHSSMAMDLRFVPADISFEGRKQRDSCSKASVIYKPPNDFVVNALQRTKVDCSWETEDAVGGLDSRGGGNRSGSTASKWRELAESDMQQYLANSSGSESEDAGDEEGSDCSVSVAEASDDDSDGEMRGAKKKMSKKAAKLRKLLLGGSDDDSDGSGGGGRDDFFLDDEEMSGGQDEVEDGAVDKVFTFVPDADSSDERNAKKKKELESPADALKRKRLEKKRAKRDHSDSSAQEAMDNSAGALSGGSVTGKKGKKKDSPVDSMDADEQKKLQNLELMFGDETEHTGDDRLRYSKKEFEKAVKNKDKKKKGKKKQVEGDIADDDFEVDLRDTRFGAVLDGTNPNFGIDPLSNEYRPTDAMKKILSEQQSRRRAARESKESARDAVSITTDSAPKDSSDVDINHLVSKLKAKSGSGNRKRLRGAT